MAGGGMNFGQIIILSTIFISMLGLFNIYLLLTRSGSVSSESGSTARPTLAVHGDGGGGEAGEHCFDWNNVGVDEEDKDEKKPEKRVCYKIDPASNDLNPCIDDPVTGKRKCLPQYMIIGFPKTGTSTLYYWLSKHPSVMKPVVKETDYFEHWIETGKHSMEYYTSLFPAIPAGSGNITGEATTKYATSLDAPWRIKSVLPKVRLIVIVRDPIEQVYSDYQMTVAWCKEQLQIDQGIRLPKMFEQWIRGPMYTKDCFKKQGGCDPWDPVKCRMCRRLGNGVYVDWLTEWYDLFASQQILVLRTEELKQNPLAVMRRVEKHLGIREHEWGTTLDAVVNVGGGGKDTRGIYQVATKESLQKFDSSKYLRETLNYNTREYLANFYHSHNERLRDLLKWPAEATASWIKPRSEEELAEELVYSHCFNYTDIRGREIGETKNVCYKIGYSNEIGWNPCFDMDGRRECMAHFIIIGWPKCGTSSLYYYINDHSLAKECRVKETDFFEYWLVHNNPDERLGHQYYASLFPKVDPPYFTGEATTKYSTDLEVPERIKATLPFARLIVVFRNPPDQIYSNYLMTIRWVTKHNSEQGVKRQFGLPPPFDDYIKEGRQCFESRKEMCDISYSDEGNGPKEQSSKSLVTWALSTPAGRSETWNKQCTYQCDRLGDAIYADYMENWLSVFPRDQFLVIRTQDLEKFGADVMAEVDHFLYLPHHDYSKILQEVVNTKHVPDIYNVTVKENLEKQLEDPDPLSPQTRRWMTQFFYPHNMRLEDLVSIQMDWSTDSMFKKK